MLIGLLLAHLSPTLNTDAVRTPPYCAGLGRELSWDPFGIYPLDADRPLTKAGAQIVKYLQTAELGRAESLARYRLKVDGEDLVPAWALGQILRVRHAALNEYRRLGDQGIESPATLPVLLYRLHVCRIASNELIAAPKVDQSLCTRLRQVMLDLRDRCRSATSTYLGLAIGLTQVDVFWALENRAILDAYRKANPKGADVRSLLCIAYNTGVGYGPAVFPDGHTMQLSHEDEPQPKKVLEIAYSMLKDQPSDALGHFYVGRAQYRLHRADLAKKEIQIALDTGKLPPVFERVARSFLANPVPASFIPKLVY